MSGLIYPGMEVLGDRQTAEACSEAFIRAQDFRQFPLQAEEGNPDYPPEPSYIGALAIAYLDDDGNVGRKFAMFPRSEPGSDPEAIGEWFKRDYGSLIGALHGMRTNIEAGVSQPVAQAGLQEYAQAAIQQSRKVGLRTVAAFSLYTAVEAPHKHYSMMLISRAAATEIPLMQREEIIDVRNLVGASTFDAAIAEDSTEESIKKLMQNHADTEIFAFFAAALLLPDVAKIDAMTAQLAAYYAARPHSKTPDTPTTTVDQTLRRRAEKDRRRKRR
jgi:hypothetical protein